MCVLAKIIHELPRINKLTSARALLSQCQDTGLTIIVKRQLQHAIHLKIEPCEACNIRHKVNSVLNIITTISI